MHPIGEITNDVWPDALDGKKMVSRKYLEILGKVNKNFNEQSFYKRESKFIMELINKSLHVDPKVRPDINEFEFSLWEELRNHSIQCFNEFKIQIEFFEDTGNRDNWLHMDREMQKAVYFFNNI